MNKRLYFWNYLFKHCFSTNKHFIKYNNNYNFYDQTHNLQKFINYRDFIINFEGIDWIGVSSQIWIQFIEDYSAIAIMQSSITINKEQLIFLLNHRNSVIKNNLWLEWFNVMINKEKKSTNRYQLISLITFPTTTLKIGSRLVLGFLENKDIYLNVLAASKYPLFKNHEWFNMYDWIVLKSKDDSYCVIDHKILPNNFIIECIRPLKINYSSIHNYINIREVSSLEDTHNFTMEMILNYENKAIKRIKGKLNFIFDNYFYELDTLFDQINRQTFRVSNFKKILSSIKNKKDILKFLKYFLPILLGSNNWYSDKCKEIIVENNNNNLLIEIKKNVIKK